MKRFRILVALLAILLIAGIAHAASIPMPAARNVSYLRTRGALLTEQYVEVIPVRYAATTADDPGLNSGDVVVWNTTSADGITISACVASADETYAGVLVTAVATADSGSLDHNTRNWGWMAIRGFCLAKCESNATAGERLVPSSIVQAGIPGFATIDDMENFNLYISMDVGVLLEAPASEGALARVYLR